MGIELPRTMGTGAIVDHGTRKNGVAVLLHAILHIAALHSEGLTKIMYLNVVCV